MLVPLDPVSAIVRPPTTRVTHLAKKCPPMRHPISPRRLNPLKKSGLKLDDYELHTQTDASPPCDASCKKVPQDASQISAPPPQPIEK